MSGWPARVITVALVVALGFFSLVLLFAPLIVIGTPVTIFGWIFESSLEALPLTLLGIIACLLWLNATNGLAWLWALYSRVMLGPSTAALHERSTTCGTRAPASSRRATPSAGGSSATSTTARSSGWWRSR
jgi:hypothetical protein